MYIVYDLKSKVCSDVNENLNDCFNSLQELDSIQFGNIYRIINIESSKILDIALSSEELLKIFKNYNIMDGKEKILPTLA